MHASLGDGSDRLRAPRRCHRVSAVRDRRRSIPPAQAHPAGAHRPALVRTLERAGPGSAGRRQPARSLALAAALCLGGR